MAIAQLSIDLVAKVASFEADLKRVARTAEQNGDRMAAAFGLAKSALGGLVAGLSVGASVTFFRSIVDGIDALNDLADATGSSVENLSALEDVAARTGTSMDTVGGAVIKLNKVLADAKPGSDAAAALDALGLSAKELKALDPAVALQRTAVALAGFADDGNKARLTQELFGKSLAEVAPLLKDLAESGKLVSTLTKEQTDAAEAFNKELFNLQKNALDAARSLAGPLVVAINETIAKFREGAREGKGFFQTLRDEQLKLLGLGTDAPGALKNTQIELAAIEKALQRTDISAERRAELERKRIGRLETINRLQGEQSALFRPSQNYGEASRPSAPSIGGAPRATGKPASAAPSLFVGPVLDQASLDAIRALEATDTAKLAALREQLARLIEIRDGSANSDSAIAATVEQITRLDPAAQAAARSADRLATILGQTPTAMFGEVVTDITLLNAAFDEGKISAEQWGEAIRASTAKIGGDAAVEEIEKLGTFAEQAARNIQDALGDTLESVLGGNFDNIGRMWQQLLTKMVAQALATQLNNALFGSTLGGGGQGAGFIGQLFGLAGARANGGPVNAGSAYLVGERGPEIIVPRSAGTVIPNGQSMGGTQVTFAPVLNLAAGVDVATVEAMMARERMRFARMYGAT